MAAAARAAPLPTAALLLLLLLLTVRKRILPRGTTMTRGCELAAALPPRRLRRCPQSSHSARRRPASGEAFPLRVPGAVITGAAPLVLSLLLLLVVVVVVLPSLLPAVVLVLTVLKLLLLPRLL